MEIKIEKNVPVYAPSNGVRIYPFPDMEVGDSFVVLKSKRNLVYSAAVSWAKRANSTAKFSTRGDGDNVRIWRVA